MSEQENTSKNLPENAYTELKPGEEYKPVMPANQFFPEVTLWSVLMGLLMSVIFSAAAAYSGLKIGQVFEAAIPISIIAVGASAAARRKNALGQNVIIQSIGASSGVIVAGAIFTIPGLYILQTKYPEITPDFWQIFFSSLLGGFLGILFLIPFRKYFVKDMHGKFPFPEATATTEILITGEKGGSQAKILIVSGLIGGIFDFLFSAVRLWDDVITTRVLPYGDVLANKVKMVFKMNVSALIFSFGYLVGLRFSMIIAVGSFLSWFVFIPLINEIGNIVAANGGANPFADLSAEVIFKMYVRPIGIGAIAMAGIIGIIRSSGVIGKAFKLAFSGIFGGKKGAAINELRTQRDIKMTWVMLFILFTIIGIFVFLVTGVNITMVQALIALVTLVVISFLFTTVAANAIAIVGTNPVSGMTLMTLILSSFVLVAAGLKGPQGMVSSLVIGGIVCTALSMAGGFITDLKVGYWLGSSPYKQQRFKFLGTLVAAAVVGGVIFMLGKSYGYTPEQYVKNQNIFSAAEITRFENHGKDTLQVSQCRSMIQKATPYVLYKIDDFKNTSGSVMVTKGIALCNEYKLFEEPQTAVLKSYLTGNLQYHEYELVLATAKPLVAPQANAMAAVIEPLMMKDAHVQWGLYLIGAIISFLMYLIGISPLAFALGMFIPLDLNTPLVVGGLLANWFKKSTKNAKLNEARSQRGTLIASGFIAGAALFGVFGAILLFFNVNPDAKLWEEGSVMPQLLAFITFVLLIVYFVWDSFRAKEND
jgi:putative OPT family oligopeptide transporter